MTFGPIGSHPIAAVPSSAVALSSVGTLGPLVGFGQQGEQLGTRVLFWAHESHRLYWAKESDTEMLGIVDIDPSEKVWRGIEWKDLLSGASIQSLSQVAMTGLTVHSSSIDGTVTWFLVSAVQTNNLVTIITASDGSKRTRRLRYKVRDL